MPSDHAASDYEQHKKFKAAWEEYKAYRTRITPQ